MILGNTKLKVSFMMEEMRKVGNQRRSNKGTLSKQDLVARRGTTEASCLSANEFEMARTVIERATAGSSNKSGI